VVLSNDIADTLAAYLPITLEQKVKILAERTSNTRLPRYLDVILSKKRNRSDSMRKAERTTVRGTRRKIAKGIFLREKMKAIKDELGEGEDDEKMKIRLRKKLEKNPYPDNVKARVKRASSSFRDDARSFPRSFAHQ